MGYIEKIKFSNYRNRWGGRIPGQWPRPDVQGDHRIKLPQTKKRHTHTYTCKKHTELQLDISYLKH